VQSAAEDAFINTALNGMLRSVKWGQPLRALFAWINESEADDNQEIVIDDVKKELEESTEHLKQKSTDWLALFKKLQGCNYGKLTLGRRGFPTRFRWHESPLSLARTVNSMSGEQNTGSKQTDFSKRPISGDALLVYIFPLRHGVTASVHVPADITGEELGRLADFTRLLPGR
jgi:hypothetical protein